MCRPPLEHVAGSEFRFVAIDPDVYNGTAIRGLDAHKAFWDHQMNGRPASMPFLKSGLAIFKKLKIADPPEAVAYMMQMNSVDAETAEAVQAAIFSAFNTASYPIDIETAVFVLAAFMHADPLRKHLVSDQVFIEPYGDRTQYVLRAPTTGNAGGNGDGIPDAPPPSGPRYLPVEADDALRQRIMADELVHPSHLMTLDRLKLLMNSEAEKDRVFFGGYDQKARAIMNDLLMVGIQEIEEVHATVAGVVDALIERMMDICGELRHASEIEGD